MDIVLLLILSGALYRMATGYNIRPWRWVINFTGAFLATMMLASIALVARFGTDVTNNKDAMAIIYRLSPFTMLYQFLLFMYFRTMMKKYVGHLDKLEAYQEEAEKPQRDTRDFSHFR
ncbi:MAG: hypothetical protein U0T84_07320 [Chitinophagales bacterium]